MLTVVVPHKDRHENLRKCLDSLAAQTIRPRVVVPDWSDTIMDGFVFGEGVEVALFSMVRKEKFERGVAVNRGREYVETPLMMRLDADIIFDPDGIEKVLKAFGNPPKKLFLGFHGVEIGEKGKKKELKYCRNRVYGGFQVYRTEDFDAVGGYNPFCEDWGYEDDDLRNRMLAHGCEEVILDDEFTHLWHPATRNQLSAARNERICRASFYDKETGKWCRKF